MERCELCRLDMKSIEKIQKLEWSNSIVSIEACLKFSKLIRECNCISRLNEIAVDRFFK